MPNLLETIQQNRATLAGQQAPVTDETQKVATLLRAKSGRTVGSGDTAMSNLGEQGAADTTNAAMVPLQQQAQLQTQQENVQQAGQQQQEALQKQDIAQAKKYDTVQSRIQTNNILQNLAQNKGQLDLQQQQSGLEQASFLLSMQDKSYTDSLQDVGKRRRLDDAAAFQDEMQQMAFGNNLDLLKQKLGDRDVLTASDREFKKAMSDLSIDDAMQIAAVQSQAAEAQGLLERQGYSYEAAQKAAAASTAAKYQGFSGLLSGGLQAANLAGNYKSAPLKTTSVGKTDTDTSLASVTA